MYTGLEGFLQPFMSLTLVWWIAIGTLVGMVLFAFAYQQSQSRHVGHLKPGAPELHADSRYNRDAAAIVEWVKGTGLRPYLDRIPAQERDGFLADYEARIGKAYAPMADGRRLLRFPRLFIVAVKA